MKTGPGVDSHPAERAGGSIETLRKAAATCRACPLWENATQTVFGEGPASASVMLIGEQPGDQEDRTGHPFVALPASFWFERWQQSISRVSRFILPMPSSTSNLNFAASAVFTKNLSTRKLPRVTTG